MELGLVLIFHRLSSLCGIRHKKGRLERPVLCVRALATVNPSKISQVPKEQDNDESKAGSKDRDSDSRNDRYFRSSERSIGAFRGRRPPHSVPTEGHELPVLSSDPAKLVSGRNAAGQERTFVSGQWMRDRHHASLARVYWAVAA